MKNIRAIRMLLILCMILLLLTGCGKDARREAIPVEQLDEQTVQYTMEQYDKVVADAEPIIAEYLDENGFATPENLDDALLAISEYARTLYEDGEITHYSYTPGDTCVYMEIDGWLGMIYDVPLEGAMAGGSDEMQIVTLEPYASDLKFSLAYVLSGAEGPVEAAELIADTFPGFDYERKERDAEVTVESFRQEIKNGVMILFGHGNYTEEMGSILFTGIKEYDPATILLYTLEFGDKAIVMNEKGYFYLTPIFFEKYVPENAFEGSLLYLGTCCSLADGRLAQALIDKGARAVLGNDSIVWAQYSFGMIDSFFEGLTLKPDGKNYMTVSEALQYAKDQEGEVDPIYGAEVIACGGDDFSLAAIAVTDGEYYYFTPDVELSIYDVNDELYGDYSLDITGTTDAGRSVEQVTEVWAPTSCGLDLDEGTYTFILRDGANPMLEETIQVRITQYGASEMDWHTFFGCEEPIGGELVSDEFYDEVIDEYAPTKMRCYHIPKINLTGKRFDELNDQIYKKLFDIIDKNVYAYPDFPLIAGMSYTWGTANDVLSIVVEVPSLEADWTDYYIYNLSVQTGFTLKDSETIEACGYTEEEFYDAVYNALKYFWDTEGADISDIASKSEINYCRNETLSDENIRSAIPWINEDGALCSLVPVSWPIGGGGFYLLLDMDGNVVEESFDCGMSHIYIPAEDLYPEETKTELKEIKINQQVLQGTWHIDDNYTMDYNDVGMTEIFGSGYKYGNGMQFGSNSEFSYWVGIGTGGDGSYTLAEKSVSADIVSYEDGGKEKVELKAISNDGVVRLVQEMYDYIIFWIKD